MSDRTNECAIYLCLPAGFPGGCESSYSAYLKRISTFTSGKHPQRKYTDLPDFSLCEDPNPDGVEDFAVGDNSVITYQGAYEVHMPAYNTCTRWKYRDSGENQVRYCGAVQTTPARVFESGEKYHEYQTIAVGQREYTSGYAPTRHYTMVLVDGEAVGERYYD